MPGILVRIQTWKWPVISAISDRPGRIAYRQNLKYIKNLSQNALCLEIIVYLLSLNNWPYTWTGILNPNTFHCKSFQHPYTVSSSTNNARSTVLPGTITVLASCGVTFYSQSLLNSRCTPLISYHLRSMCVVTILPALTGLS